MNHAASEAQTVGGNVHVARQDGVAARVVAVIDALARSPRDGVGVRELAGDLGVSRSAVHRVLQRLREMHVARMLPTGNYAPGPLMAGWGAFMADENPLLSPADDILGWLTEATGEASYLFSYMPGDLWATVVQGRQCDRPIRYVVEIGSRAPLHLGAAGKAILAQLPESTLLRIGSEFELTDQHVEEYRVELQRIRDDGYAWSMGERIPDASGVAAASFSEDGPAGSITISVPSYRFDRRMIPDLGEQVVAAARELSYLLSARPVASRT